MADAAPTHAKSTTELCKLIGISRPTFYSWKQDPACPDGLELAAWMDFKATKAGSQSRLPDTLGAGTAVDSKAAKVPKAPKAGKPGTPPSSPDKSTPPRVTPPKAEPAKPAEEEDLGVEVEDEDVGETAPLTKEEKAKLLRAKFKGELAKNQRLTHEAERARIAVEKELDRLIAIDEIKAGLIAIAEKTKLALRRLETDLPAALAGLTEPEIQARLIEATDAICDELHKGLDSLAISREVAP